VSVKDYTRLSSFLLDVQVVRVYSLSTKEHQVERELYKFKVLLKFFPLQSLAEGESTHFFSNKYDVIFSMSYKKLESRVI